MTGHPGGHEHIWAVVSFTRDASGSYNVIRRCSCRVERHSLEDDRPDDEDTPRPPRRS